MANLQKKVSHLNENLSRPQATTFPHKVGVPLSVEVILVFALKIGLLCGKNLTQLFVQIM